ncbi:MAG TPA: LppX_LprAFG lipoprotein [Nocardioides sp.]|uniref:LppX_LprAFG lipoprotein n=1 Tax=Nocardioides sp. TaxID=35761 RepID=UPI002CF21857|nr:LppX_LprAFG lipoprotein [Nocardioides sp.]HQR26766.1 LppX_LprAFG lipoprotein [Nocardioides sp.]
MPVPPRALAVLVLVGVTLLTGLTGCSDSQASPEGKSPEQVLAEAKTTLDETSGLRLRLATDDLPEGVQGLTAATGAATHAPAFDGTISVIFAGQSVDVPVVAVDRRVYAQIPLTIGWSDVDPSEYGAPDPAALMDPETGLSSLLPATEGLTEGDSVRGGADNDEILTEYTGTVPGAAMKQVIPSATGDSFDVTYTVTDGGELRQAVLTGVFYAGSPSMTYTVDFEDYGSTPEITAP